MFNIYDQQLHTLQGLLEAYCKGEDEASTKKTLKNYLNAQDMAFVKLVQVIIYVGKTKQEVDVQTKQQLYDEVMSSFNQFKGWRPQEIEVNNMIFKVPLDEQFKKGMDLFDTLQ